MILESKYEIGDKVLILVGDSFEAHVIKDIIYDGIFQKCFIYDFGITETTMIDGLRIEDKVKRTENQIKSKEEAIDYHQQTINKLRGL